MNSDHKKSKYAILVKCNCESVRRLVSWSLELVRDTNVYVESEIFTFQCTATESISPDGEGIVRTFQLRASFTFDQEAKLSVIQTSGPACFAIVRMAIHQVDVCTCINQSIRYPCFVSSFDVKRISARGALYVCWTPGKGARYYLANVDMLILNTHPMKCRRLRVSKKSSITLRRSSSILQRCICGFTANDDDDDVEDNADDCAVFKNESEDDIYLKRQLPKIHLDSSSTSARNDREKYVTFPHYLFLYHGQYLADAARSGGSLTTRFSLDTVFDLLQLLGKGCVDLRCKKYEFRALCSMFRMEALVSAIDSSLNKTITADVAAQLHLEHRIWRNRKSDVTAPSTSKAVSAWL